MTASPLALAADPALPARDLLLDEGRVAARLARLLGAPSPLAVTGCERVKAKYRIGESLRVLYRVEVDGAWRLVAGRMFPAGRSEEVFQRAATREQAAGPFRPVAHDAAINTVFWSFPNDRKIPDLGVLERPPLDLSLPPSRRWHTSRIVAYAPERAATALCLGARSEILAFTKVYANEDGAASERIHRALHHSVAGTDRDLRLPRAYGYSPSTRVLVVEPLAGRALGALDEAELTRGFGRLGAALARLHEVPPFDLPRFRRLDPERLRQAAALIARARPDVGAAAEALAGDLVDQWRPSDQPAVVLHGDVNSRNWLLQPRRVALIDLDQAALGPAAADLAGALAGIDYRLAVGEVAGGHPRLRRALLAGYVARRPLPAPDQLRWHEAAAVLVERALRAVTRLRAEGLRHLPRLIETGRARLAGALDD